MPEDNEDLSSACRGKRRQYLSVKAAQLLVMSRTPVETFSSIQGHHLPFMDLAKRNIKAYTSTKRKLHPQSKV